MRAIRGVVLCVMCVSVSVGEVNREGGEWRFLVPLAIRTCVLPFGRYIDRLNITYDKAKLCTALSMF